jgi:hypothetical protein
MKRERATRQGREEKIITATAAGLPHSLHLKSRIRSVKKPQPLVKKPHAPG